jgi:glycerol-3-phosphate cytidylyltransferase-like family protein
MIPGRIDFLQATYGRHGCVEESLACFLAFDYPNRHLFLLNTHPVPLAFSHPLVTVVNEPTHLILGQCRNRLLELAEGEFCAIFDDDDHWLPWHCSTAMRHIGDAPAYKPNRSWWCDGSGMGTGQKRAPMTFELASNAMEASIIWRTAWVREQGGWYVGQGEESRTLLQRLGSHLLTVELYDWSSYCYSWMPNQFHASQTIGTPYTVIDRATDWRDRQNDARPGVPLSPNRPAVVEWWRKLSRFVPLDLRSPWLLAAIGGGAAHVPPVRSNLTKIMPADTAARIYTGRRVVAVPGCWDVLHTGHEHTLQTARRQAGAGGAVVVLVNEDDGVRAQKGSGANGVQRPLLTCDVRALTLSSLPYIDAVIRVHGDDDRETLMRLRPAAIVKGPDYSGRAVRNADLVPELIIAPPCEKHVRHLSDHLSDHLETTQST